MMGLHRLPTMGRAQGGRRLAAASLLAALAACGGSSPSGSSSTATPEPPGIPASTTLSVVSGESGAPVAGAQVLVAGRSYRTDGGGQLTLDARAPTGSLVDVLAAGFFDRQTQVRADLLTRFVLWPRTSSVGIDDDGYTATIVYTSGIATPPPTGSSPLVRLPRGTTQVVIVPSAQIQKDDYALPRHESSIAALNEALGGQVTYQLANTRPATGIAFDTLVEPTDAFCLGQQIAAYTSSALSGSQITGGRIVFCSLDWARSTLVVHELGHTFGLQHSPRGDDAMIGRAREWPRRYSRREELIMKLMLERPAGNRFPDNDRSVGSASQGTLTIACPY